MTFRLKGALFHLSASAASSPARSPSPYPRTPFSHTHKNKKSCTKSVPPYLEFLFNSNFDLSFQNLTKKMPMHVCYRRHDFYWQPVGLPELKMRKILEKMTFGVPNWVKNNHRPTLFVNWSVFWLKLKGGQNKKSAGQNPLKIPLFDHWNLKSAQKCPNSTKILLFSLDFTQCD